MFESYLLNSFFLSFDYQKSTLLPGLIFILISCLLLVTFFAQTYLYLMVTLEICLVIFCALFFLAIPYANGLVYSIFILIIAAGEAALLLLMMYSIREDSSNLQPLVDNQTINPYY